MDHRELNQEALTPGHLKKAKLMFFSRYPTSSLLKAYFPDIQVPDGFLDVASLTLQEFFSAVRAGRDLDPSWKKPIYKIISKLDSEIPDVFKSSNCPKEFTQD